MEQANNNTIKVSHFVYSQLLRLQYIARGESLDGIILNALSFQSIYLLFPEDQAKLLHRSDVLRRKQGVTYQGQKRKKFDDLGRYID